MRITVIMVCALSITTEALSPAFGADAVALISSVAGKVEIRGASETQWRTADIGNSLFEGDVLQTREQSKASLFFPDGSIVVVRPKSRLQLSTVHTETDRQASRIASVSSSVMGGIIGMFSPEKKRETLTAIPGIRKRTGEDDLAVRILYPRNSKIPDPPSLFRWEIEGKNRRVMASLTLKGRAGRLWAIQTGEGEIGYPRDQRPLERGETYFLRIESLEDASAFDEVFFRVLEDQSAEELGRVAAQMKEIRNAHPDDSTPEFVLAVFCKDMGLYHMALDQLDELETRQPGNRFVLSEKKEIFARMGLWNRWEKVNQKLSAP